MRDFLVALGIGATLGLGLAVSSMTNPDKVLNFLDVTGSWDPSLALVLMSAVLVAAVGYRLTRYMSGPVFGDRFQFPTGTKLDLHLVSGAAIFGVGWGLVGFCPGPALESIIVAPHSAIWFVPAMLLGLWIGRPVHRRAVAGAEPSPEGGSSSANKTESSSL